jgi:hypothetical protein
MKIQGYFYKQSSTEYSTFEKEFIGVFNTIRTEVLDRVK